jgi:hypothetical protein
MSSPGQGPGAGQRSGCRCPARSATADSPAQAVRGSRSRWACGPDRSLADERHDFARPRRLRWPRSPRRRSGSGAWIVGSCLFLSTFSGVGGRVPAVWFLPAGGSASMVSTTSGVPSARFRVVRGRGRSMVPELPHDEPGEPASVAGKQPRPQASATRTPGPGRRVSRPGCPRAGLSPTRRTLSYDLRVFGHGSSGVRAVWSLTRRP